MAVEPLINGKDDQPDGGAGCVVEIYWRQRASGRWRACLVDRATGATREVSSRQALQAALKEFQAASRDPHRP